MIFRYWKSDGKATVIKDVDRVMFNSLDQLEIRADRNGISRWRSFSYGDDYKQFTLSQE